MGVVEGVSSQKILEASITMKYINDDLRMPSQEAYPER
jgi:hypothetical protein